MDLVTPWFKSHFRAENRILTVPHPRRSRTKRTCNQCSRFRSLWRFNHAPGEKCMRLPRVKAKSVREVKCKWYAAARSKEVW